LFLSAPANFTLVKNSELLREIGDYVGELVCDILLCVARRRERRGC
jgi:hypothetical protein